MRDPLHFCIFENYVATPLGALNTGRTGKCGTVSVQASHRGFTVKIAGKTIAQGKTPAELHRNYTAAVAEIGRLARQAEETNHGR